MRLHQPIVAAGSEASPNDSSARDTPRTYISLRRRLFWIALAALVVALLVLTPPLINANRYHRQIADTMSASLGRAVHLDNVSLHLLPVPGFTLQNLVVSEDPAFGSEPTIRANTVEATLRISSLWRRPVEFSSIRFIEPSVNLVRNGQGRWNLADVLLRTSYVNTAPTDQRRHGPAPRFPYIEATGGRVNIKFVDQKLPFSLTDADFALWLPSPQRWRVRLTGHPARTDVSITDPGTVRLEGDLRRGAAQGVVPIALHASWHDAPLGEASRMLTGDDMGWRGTLNLDTVLAGSLGEARMDAKLTLGGLRRADFVPSQALDLQVTCATRTAVALATLSDLACNLPVGAPEPLTLRAASLDLQHPAGTAATLIGSAIPLRRALLWASLFSSRIPTDLTPSGTFDIDLARAQVGAAPPAVRRKRTRVMGTEPVTSQLGTAAWTGQIRLNLPASTRTPGDVTAKAPADPVAAGNVLAWSVHLASTQPGGDAPWMVLPPTPVRLGTDGAVTVDSAILSTGYRVGVKGSLSPATLLTPARYLPQLGDGLNSVLPQPVEAMQPMRVDFNCSRTWTATQVCTGPRSGVPSKAVPSSLPALAPQTPQPSLLNPRSQSPYDHSPQIRPSAPR